jgi:hypothetical protein
MDDRIIRTVQFYVEEIVSRQPSKIAYRPTRSLTLDLAQIGLIWIDKYHIRIMRGGIVGRLVSFAVCRPERDSSVLERHFNVKLPSIPGRNLTKRDK